MRARRYHSLTVAARSAATVVDTQKTSCVNGYESLSSVAVGVPRQAAADSRIVVRAFQSAWRLLPCARLLGDNYGRSRVIHGTLVF
ncbi:MAG: hypothetical protein ACP5I8_02200 [Phycisphaerae bacterium]